MHCMEIIKPHVLFCVVPLWYEMWKWQCHFTRIAMFCYAALNNHHSWINNNFFLALPKSKPFFNSENCVLTLLSKLLNCGCVNITCGRLSDKRGLIQQLFSTFSKHFQVIQIIVCQVNYENRSKIKHFCGESSKW